ncbi:MAG: SAM-dependent methyltransferase [Clostridia bacterium]|nr:SAM-dependent methyltransferase [Clostridia bacterium]
MKVLSDGRLLAAASFVRDGSVFADIGTDHAYLPLYLLSRGRILRAVAADIGEGPLSRAHANIAAAGEDARVKTVLTDGLCGLDKEGLSDVAICGMGGELIVRILSDAPFVRDPSIRLILQPMTREAVLRRYLAESGFAILDERPCRAAGRVYTCLCVEYDGVRRTLTDVQAEVGCPSCGTEEEKEAFCELLSRKIRVLTDKKEAIQAAHHTPSGSDEHLLAALLEIRNEMGNDHDGKTAL